MSNPFGLNTEKPSVMWIDLNSAFATAEQQAHPSLRGKPIGVTNRLSKECYRGKLRGEKTRNKSRMSPHRSFGKMP